MAAKKIRGFAPWRPQAETECWITEIQRVLEEDRAYWPVSGRYIMYRLLGTEVCGVIVKKPHKAQGAGEENEPGHMSKIYGILNRGRRSGLIPWEAIADEGIVSVLEDSFRDPAHFWNNMGYWAEDYHRPLQQDQPIHVEVWCEAAGMAQRLSTSTLPYGVSVYAGGGFDSVTSKYQAAKRIADRSVATKALHIGDLDKHGHYLYDAVAEDVTEMVYSLGGLVVVSRLAVTPEQPMLYDLELSEEGTFQAEALPASIMDAVIRAALDELLDASIREAVIEQSNAERAEILAVVRGLNH